METLDRFDVVEQWLSTMDRDCMAVESYEHFWPMLTVDFLAFREGRGWKTYSELRRAHLGEDFQPAILPGTKQQSDDYENWRRQVLRELPEDSRHRFVLGFAIASGLDSAQVFSQLKALAAGGEFLFANIWAVVGPMTIPGFGDDLLEKQKAEGC